MGLSRNKVAVSEGAAGSPPFYGECVTHESRVTYFARKQTKDGEMTERLLFNFQRPMKRESVLLTHRVHPFPFRTRKLSCAVPKILYWRRYGKIGQGRHRYEGTRKSSFGIEKKETNTMGV